MVLAAYSQLLCLPVCKKLAHLASFAVMPRRPSAHHLDAWTACCPAVSKLLNKEMWPGLWQVKISE